MTETPSPSPAAATVTVLPAAEPMTMAFDVRVTAVEQLSPNFRRITFGGYSLRHFGVHGRHPGPADQAHDPVPGRRRQPDSRCPSSGSSSPAGTANGWPWILPSAAPCAPTPCGRHAWTPSTPKSTSTSCCTSTLPATAVPPPTGRLNAKPGDALTLIGPNNRAAHCVTAETYSGIEWRPGLAQRVLLAGDETAVPAIAAILESLPPYLSGHAFLEVPSRRATSRTSISPADVDITWLARGARDGRPPHGELLQAAVRAAVPEPGWVGATAPPRCAGPEPEDVNVDQDILWETPARLDARPSGRPEPRQARRRHAVLRLDRRRSGHRQGVAPLPGAGRGDRPEAGRVYGVLAAGEG